MTPSNFLLLLTLLSTPEEVAAQAVDADVHVVGVSSQAAGHKTLVPALVRALQATHHTKSTSPASTIKVVCGGVIPRQDHQALLDAGVVGIFGPGTPITQVNHADQQGSLTFINL